MEGIRNSKLTHQIVIGGKFSNLMESISSTSRRRKHWMSRAAETKKEKLSGCGSDTTV